MSPLTQFLGDTPLRVLLKLAVLSFIAGLVMNTLGWSPLDLFWGLRDFITGIWNMGFAAINKFVGYFLLGAAVVVPAFILVRLLSYRR